MTNFNVFLMSEQSMAAIMAVSQIVALIKKHDHIQGGEKKMPNLNNKKNKFKFIFQREIN